MRGAERSYLLNLLLPGMNVEKTAFSAGWITTQMNTHGETPATNSSVVTGAEICWLPQAASYGSPPVLPNAHITNVCWPNMILSSACRTATYVNTREGITMKTAYVSSAAFPQPVTNCQDPQHVTYVTKFPSHEPQLMVCSPNASICIAWHSAIRTSSRPGSTQISRGASRPADRHHQPTSVSP